MSHSRVSNSKLKGNGPFQRFLGISLSAGKAERTSLAVLDFYPQENRIFLSHLIDRIHTEEFASADLKLIEYVTEFSEPTESIFFDCPISLPAALASAPETADPELRWMIDQAQKIKKKRPLKNFTPYTQRAADLYFSQAMKGIFEVHHALGGNLAPLTARALYLKKKFKKPVFETNTKIAVWRVGQELGLRKSHLKNHRSAVLGTSARREFLKALVSRLKIFIYEQDIKVLVDHAHAFDSLISGLVGFWHNQKLSEPPPSNYPEAGAWIIVPKPESVLSLIDQK